MPLIISPRKRFLKEYFKKYQKMPVKFENWAGQKIGLHLSNYCFLMSKTVFEGEIPILQELFDISAFLLSFLLLLILSCFFFGLFSSQTLIIFVEFCMNYCFKQYFSFSFPFLDASPSELVLVLSLFLINYLLGN